MIFMIANKFLDIGPWWHVSGVFNLTDIGNGIILFSTFVFLIFSIRKSILINFMTFLIVFLISLACLQIFLALSYYNQNVIDGIVAIRHQLYFFSFFLFILYFSNTSEIVKFLNWLVILSIIALGLGIFNRYGFKILYSDWANRGILRSGFVRAYVPAMDIVTFASIWLMTKWTESDKSRKRDKSMFFFLLAGHIFRQSRMRLVSLLSVLVIRLIRDNRWKRIFLFMLLSGIVFIGFEAYRGKNLLSNLFESAFADSITGTGTMSPRLKMIEIDLKEFRAHPIIGGGSLALRRPSGQPTLLQLRHESLSYYFDLGYTHWLKFYGLTGMVWLFLFFAYQFISVSKIKKSNRDKDSLLLSKFVQNYLLYILFSFFTLNHFMIPSRILLLTLTASIVVILCKDMTTNQSKALPSI
jgi:hypothetical protein